MNGRKSLMPRCCASLTSVAIMSISLVTHASRANMPMGYWIPQAEVIVFADAEKVGKGITLTFREVLKGDPGMKGGTYKLPAQYSADAYTMNLRPGPEGLAVLFREGWETGRWPALEVYSQPDEFVALRKLAPVYELSREQDRLNALYEAHASDKTNSHIVQAFLDEFRGVRDRSSLQVLTDIVFKIDSPYLQMAFASQLGAMGDRRAVPALIEATRSPDVPLRRHAARALARHFPGVGGVTDALRAALHTEGTDVIAATYLMKREPSPQLEAIREAYEAEREAKRSDEARRAVVRKRVLEQGDPKAIKRYYLSAATDEVVPDLERMKAAREVVGSLSAPEKDLLRESILPLARKTVNDASKSTPLTDSALLLRDLDDSDCLDILIEILRKAKPPSSRDDCCIATMAIRELGPEARAKASAVVLDELKAYLAGHRGRGYGIQELRHYFYELAWLGDKAAFDAAGRIIDHDIRVEEEVWQYAQPWFAISDAKDEGRTLMKLLSAILQDEPGTKPHGMYWILYRLGDLREQRAAPVLLSCLDVTAGWSTWRIERLLSEALVKIGGRKVERAMKAMLPHHEEKALWKLRGQESLVKLRRSYKFKRKVAFNVLWELRSERFLPELRRMVTEDNYGLKTEAIGKLRLVGTPEDLDILLPLCDFWAPDRSLHHPAMKAVAGIRERHGYDVNGPISK